MFPQLVATPTYPDSRKEAVALGLKKYHGPVCVHCSTTLKRVRDYGCYHCHVNKHVKDYKKTPKGTVIRKAARTAYRARLATQTPAWADRKAIRVKYLEGKEKGLEVDHMIPLKGHDPISREHVVCGLHVASNLQHLTAAANRAKGSRFNPAIFEEIPCSAFEAVGLPCSSQVPAVPPARY
jgi:hypothetical protein